MLSTFQAFISWLTEVTEEIYNQIEGYLIFSISDIVYILHIMEKMFSVL